MRIGKLSKSKSSDTNESSNDEDSKMKSYITRQFKKFMKNANGKSFDKTESNLALHSSRVKIKGKRMVGMAVSTLFLQDQSALGVKVSVI